MRVGRILDLGQGERTDDRSNGPEIVARSGPESLALVGRLDSDSESRLTNFLLKVKVVCDFA